MLVEHGTRIRARFVFVELCRQRYDGVGLGSRDEDEPPSMERCSTHALEHRV